MVGDALFGEQEYVEQLHQQVKRLKLGNRVRFLGFRSDVPQLMGVCNLMAHISTAPEPFGRVIVESMLCGTPVVATKAGGAMELMEHNKTGWLIPPKDTTALSAIIHQCLEQPRHAQTIAQQAHQSARQQFHLNTIRQQIAQLLEQFAPSNQQGVSSHTINS